MPVPAGQGEPVLPYRKSVLLQACSGFSATPGVSGSPTGLPSLSLQLSSVETSETASAYVPTIANAFSQPSR